MIPKVDGNFVEQDQSLLTRAWMYHQYLFDKIINPTPAKRASKAKLIQFANIQINQNFHSEARKQNVLRRCDIITNQRELNDTIRPVLARMAEMWDALEWMTIEQRPWTTVKYAMV